MNILFVDQFGEIGGAQLCLLDLMPAVHQQGWRPIAAVPSTGPLAGRLRDEGVGVHVIEHGSYSRGRKGLADAMRLVCAIRGVATELDRLCSQYRVDLIYVNGPRLLAPIAFCSYKAPVLFHAHSYISQGGARRIARWATRRRRATIVAVSRFVAAQYNGPSYVVPNGVADLRRERSVREVPVIGVIGRIAPEKGQLLFVEAARALSGCRFVVCGAASSGAAQYEHEVRSLACGLPIEFLGWREDVGAVLADMDLLAVPSTGEEGFGRTIIEAFSANVPVVAFQTGGISELVEPGQTGFLVASRTSKALVCTLQEALRSAELCASLAQNAREAWTANYTLDLYRERLIRMMARAAGREPARPLQEPAPRQ